MLIAFASMASSKAEVELAVSEGQKVKKAKRIIFTSDLVLFAE